MTESGLAAENILTGTCHLLTEGWGQAALQEVGDRSVDEEMGF